MTSALSGIRVVALEQAVAAPLCTRHLADLGADVVKVERPPTGDFARRYDGVVHGESAYFVWLNHGKRSLGLDLATPHDRVILEALLARADVLVHNLGPGAMDRLGLDWPTLHRSWPTLISCGISGFGPDGPYAGHKAFDLLVQGEVGLASVTGGSDGPARVGVSIADIAAGTSAVIAILGALRRRDQVGEGSRLEISMLEALAEWMAVPGLVRRATGSDPVRSGLHHPSIAPYGPYAAEDGRAILVAVQNDGQWRRFCELVLEAASMADDPRFRTNADRVAHRVALDAAIGERLREVPDRDSLRRRLEAADVPFGSLNDVGDLLDHPQLAARGAWLEVDTASGPAVVPRPVIGRPGAARRSVPAFDADRAAILAELGMDVGPPRRAHPDPGGDD